ncbi:MAG: hypothetical protein CFE28_04460 [Alphaproteobacteria bacterium PA2]|nr:MAG: hypothetical protein CFE28_04460 [Alphaproteobacteria bacterium PA2]
MFPPGAAPALREVPVTLTDRIDTLVTPTFRAFLTADRAVRVAISQGNGDAANVARSAAMLAARQASAEMHRLTDAVHFERPVWLPEGLLTAAAVRWWVQEHYCRRLRSNALSTDLDLLDDIENALKHIELNPRKDPRRVVSEKAVLASETGYGGGEFCEGVYDGAEQMIVTLTDGTKRPLSAILQNCLDAWTLAAGRTLPPIEQ